MKKFKNCLLSLPRTGSNWVRYWFEYFSNENTSERNILVEVNHWGKPRTSKNKATLYKRHSLTQKDIENREVENLVLLLRDYRESFVRYCRGNTFQNQIQRMSEYTDNLKTYDSFKGNKMIMYYEDFVLYPKVYMKQFLDFLEIKNEWGDINIENHRNISVKLYESGGSKIVGKQTKGAPSLTKGKADFQFHQQCLDKHTIYKLENYFKCNYTLLHDKYLSRYKI